MRVLTLLGSPRPNGNTAHVLNWVERTLRGETHTVERITLINHTIAPCRECLECREPSAQCVQTADEANAIIDQICKADVVILASPVFCWGFPAHAKALLDRMYSLVGDYEHNPEYASKLANKPMALLLTCAGAEEGNAELVIRAFYSMVRFLKAVPAGHLLIPFFRKPEDLTARDHSYAMEFALRTVARG